jgi:hypothetical protein
MSLSTFALIELSDGDDHLGDFRRVLPQFFADRAARAKMGRVFTKV